MYIDEYLLPIRYLYNSIEIIIYLFYTCRLFKNIILSTCVKNNLNRHLDCLSLIVVEIGV